MSRADAGSRRITNESEVMAHLEPLGFERVVLGKKSVEAQRALFGEAGIVVLPHGAAAANMLFAGTGARLVERVPRSYAHPMFRHIAKWSGHWYGRIGCDATPSGDMSVHLGTLARVVEAAM